MSFSTIIEVAIGLLLFYLLLSLICTTLNEIVAQLLKMRARDLSNTIVKLIDHDQMRKTFYNHGLIINAKIASRRGNADQGTPLEKDQQTTFSGEPKDKAHPSYIDSKSFAMALLDSINPGVESKFPTIAAIETSVAALPDGNIRDVLLANLATANNDLVKLRDNLAGWFDATMERLGGSYTRKMKWVSLAVGLLLAALLNGDSLRLANELWRDDDLRAEVVAQAESTLSAMRSKVDADCETEAATAPAEERNSKRLECLAGRLDREMESLKPFPLGWPDASFPARLASSENWTEWLREREFWSWGGLKLVGLLLTGVALSLGAPFWFDILQKFMNVRSAGAEPKKQNG